MNRLLRVVISEELHNAYRDLLYSSKKYNENDLQRKLAIFLDRAERDKDTEDKYYEFLRESYANGDNKEKLKAACALGGEPCKNDVIYHQDWIHYLKSLKEVGVLDEDTYSIAVKRLEKIFVSPEILARVYGRED